MLLKLMILSLVFLAVAAAGSARAENPVVAVETNLGTFKLELFADKAPITTKNFLGYVEDKFYDGTVFHRVIDGFMIQGGGFEPGLKQKKTKAPIQNEAANGVKNARGTIAMARTSDPHSATAQFFVNTVDNSRNLGPGGVDPVGYAVFGQVTEGMDVVDKIVKAETTARAGMRDVPKDDIVIKSVRVVEKK